MTKNEELRYNLVLLKQYQEWRRGFSDELLITPTEVGNMLDYFIEKLELEIKEKK